MPYPDNSWTISCSERWQAYAGFLMGVDCRFEKRCPYLKFDNTCVLTGNNLSAESYNMCRNDGILRDNSCETANRYEEYLTYGCHDESNKF